MAKTIPEIEAEWQLEIEETEMATFGMGCFWSPDARFGAVPGVIRTRVGFAGGTTESPEYRKMGDHTETLQVIFDPKKVSFEEIIRIFWGNHTSTNRVSYKERQYMSLLFYHSEKQKSIIEKVKKELENKRNEQIETEIEPFQGFTRAENRHQKHYLKRFVKASSLLRKQFSSEKEFTDSTLIARLNGFVKEYCTLNDIKEELEKWDIREESRDELHQILKTLRW